MVKNLKSKVLAAAVAALAVGNVMLVSAEGSTIVNIAEYSGYVSKTKDYVSENLIKTTVRDDGTNVVYYIDEGSWCSWIGNYLGMRVTKKVEYSSPEVYYMEFESDAQIDSDSTEHLNTQLHVSTTILEFGSSNTSGQWSPDSYIY